MKIQFSQKRFKNTDLANQIHDLLYALITPRFREGLLVKVLFYINPDRRTIWAGNYRNIWHHGFYEDEWNMKGIDSVITLKVGFDIPPDKLLYLIAHELGHHILGQKDRGQGEVRADKLAAKLIQRYSIKHQEVESHQFPDSHMRR